VLVSELEKLEGLLLMVVWLNCCKIGMFVDGKIVRYSYSWSNIGGGSRA
jgi:hypothetical protein